MCLTSVLRTSIIPVGVLYVTDLNTSEHTQARQRRRKSRSHQQLWVCDSSDIRAAVGAESGSPGATFQRLTRDMNGPPSCKQNTPVYPACAGQGRKPNPNFLMVPINIFLAGWAFPQQFVTNTLTCWAAVEFKNHSLLPSSLPSEQWCPELKQKLSAGLIRTEK